MASDALPKHRVSSRRAAREAALQALYEIAVTGVRSNEALADVLSRHSLDPQTESFATELVTGVQLKLAQLDKLIAPHMAAGWDYRRIAIIDKCALRLATYELHDCPGVPPKVTINEAVQLAKTFNSEEGARFVNGVLAQLLPKSPKADWDPSQEVKLPEPEVETETLPEVEEAEDPIEEGSSEHKNLMRQVPWQIRKEGE